MKTKKLIKRINLNVNSAIFEKLEKIALEQGRDKTDILREACFLLIKRYEGMAQEVKQ